MVTARRPRRSTEVEALHATVHAALEHLQALRKLIPATAFQWPTEQHTVNAADAFLAEQGKPVEIDRFGAVHELWLKEKGR